MRRAVIIISRFAWNIGRRVRSAQEAPLIRSSRRSPPGSSGSSPLSVTTDARRRRRLHEGLSPGLDGAALLALEYARPHSRSSQRSTLDAIRKGFALITRIHPSSGPTPPDSSSRPSTRKTPTATKLIGLYATMLVLTSTTGRDLRVVGTGCCRPGVPAATRRRGHRLATGRTCSLHCSDSIRRTGWIPGAEIVWTRSVSIPPSAAPDGAGLQPEYRLRPYANMTIASTIPETCARRCCCRRAQAVHPRLARCPSRTVLKWIANNWIQEKWGEGR